LPALKHSARGTFFGGKVNLPAAGGDWNIVSIGDFDGDTHTDFLWRNGAGELVIWYMVNLGFPSADDIWYLGNPGNAWQVIKP
jgi:hypothetical protein